MIIMNKKEHGSQSTNFVFPFQCGGFSYGRRGTRIRTKNAKTMRKHAKHPFE